VNPEDLRQLYQDVILDHSRRPCNHHVLENPTGQHRAFNPSCGYEVTVFVKITNDLLEDISFTGAGCSISQASASMMTQLLKGKTVTEAETLVQKFEDMLLDISKHPDYKELKSLQTLQGVREFPERIKCATLAWHAFTKANSTSH
jgi:nitrogen fixation NifU-like protein